MKPSQRLLSQLKEALGVQEDASDLKTFKAIATALGYSVAKDGSLLQPEHNDGNDFKPPKNSNKKRPRSVTEQPPSPPPTRDLEDNQHKGKEDVDTDTELDTMFINPIKVQDTAAKPKMSHIKPKTKPQNTYKTATNLFEWLISPMPIPTFFSDAYEHQPVLISRKSNRSYYQGIFSKTEIERLLLKGLHYTTEVDVTLYDGQTRTTINTNDPQGRIRLGNTDQIIANSEIVWKRHNTDGCSVRLLHPQRHCDPLYKLLAGLEVFWQCNVGCNVYLTPAGSQGFAPHWDDIEAYVLQIEGKKRWRLYAPTAPNHILPRYSSRDFTQGELGQCILDVVLKPGDLLYMPRGTVHQAEALPESHSLHLTLSCNQQRTWAVYMEELLPKAIKVAAQEHLRLRKCLPRDMSEFMGCMHSDGGVRGEGEDYSNTSSGGENKDDDDDDVRRRKFKATALSCIEAIAEHLPLDWAADVFAADFMTHRLPPVLSAAANGIRANKDEKKQKSSTIFRESKVHLVQPGIARLIIDEEGDEPAAVVVHCLSNSRSSHASKTQQQGIAGGGGDGENEEDVYNNGIPAEIEFSIACLDTLAALLRAVDAEHAVAVDELPEPDDDEFTALQLAQSLGVAGVLVPV